MAVRLPLIANGRFPGERMNLMSKRKLAIPFKPGKPLMVSEQTYHRFLALGKTWEERWEALFRLDDRRRRHKKPKPR